MYKKKITAFVHGLTDNLNQPQSSCIFYGQLITLIPPLGNTNSAEITGEVTNLEERQPGVAEHSRAASY